MCKSCRIDFDALDEIPDPLHYRLKLALARYTDRIREAWPAELPDGAAALGPWLFPDVWRCLSAWGRNRCAVIA